MRMKIQAIVFAYFNRDDRRGQKDGISKGISVTSRI